MTQVTFGSNAAPSQPLLDQNFTQLYDLREQVSTVGYAALTPKFYMDTGGALSAGNSHYWNVSGGNGAYLAVTHPTGTPGASQYAIWAYNSASIGSITQSGTTAVLYNTTSDARLKKDVTDAPEAGAIVDAIRVRSFTWRSAEAEQVTHGFIAQELALVAPQAVKVGDFGDEVSDVWAVDPSKLVALLVREVQSLRRRLAALEGQA